MEYRQIVWLASYPKSGNTWLRLFLEAYFLNSVDINDMVVSVGDDNMLRSAVADGYSIKTAPVQIQNLTRPMNLLRLVVTYNQQNSPIPLFVKTHFAHVLANGIETLPESLTKAVVYLVRDPRDVVLSFAKHMGLTIDEAIERMHNHYNVLEAEGTIKLADFVSSWDKHTHGYVYGDTHNIRVFKYEDLRADPVKVFAEILRHSGINPDLDQVKRAVELTQINKMRDQEEQKGFREQSPHGAFFGKGAVGGWKDTLTPLQLRKMDKYFGAMMRRLGYTGKRAAA